MVDDPLSASEQAHLIAAPDDEYQARATYAQVIEDFGDVRPFSNIVEAEDRHARALISLFERYGVPVPPDTWPDRAPRYGSLREACEAGVAAEIANAGLYDELLSGTERADVRRVCEEVYQNLREASQERHLPAFRRCASRDAGDTPDRDHGHRRRRRGC